MKIKVYKHIVMFLLPAALTGCSGKEDSLRYKISAWCCSMKREAHIPVSAIRCM